MLTDGTKTLEFSGTLKAKSKSAFLIDFGDRQMWIPASQCEYQGRDTWIIAEWLAKQKGLCG